MPSDASRPIMPPATSPARRNSCCRASTTRRSPARSTAPTTAASSSPRRSQSAAIARAWMPDVSSQETVKLGPPIRYSRAIRLATMPPSEPGGPVGRRARARPRFSAHRSTLRDPRREAQARASGSIPGPVPPATSGDDSWSCSGRARFRSGRRSRAQADRPSERRASASDATCSISDCCGSISPSSFGRNPKLIDPKFEVVDEEAGKRAMFPGPGDETRGFRGFPTSLCGGDAAICRSPSDHALPKAGTIRSSGPKWAATPTIAIGRAGRSAREPKPAGTRRRAAAGGASGAATHSSIKTWALMPPNPNPLTAARRGCPGALARPGLALLEHAKRAFLEPQLGGSLLEIRGGRQLPVLE